MKNVFVRKAYVNEEKLIINSYAELNRNINQINRRRCQFIGRSLTLQLYFEDEQSETLYQVNQDVPLLKVMQHRR